MSRSIVAVFLTALAVLPAARGDDANDRLNDILCQWVSTTACQRDFRATIRLEEREPLVGRPSRCGDVFRSRTKLELPSH